MTVYGLNSLFVGEEEINKYLPYLPKDRQIKIEKALSFTQKQIQMAAGILIGYSLWKVTKSKDQDIPEIHMLSEEEFKGFLKEPESRLHYVLEYGEHGKPYFPLHKEWHFNLSHSGNYVVCAVDEVPVGIDIQKIDAKKGRRVADRFFGKEEQEILNQAPEEEFERLFCRFWAAKESYLKYIGTGLQGNLSSHVVDLAHKRILDSNGKQLAALQEFDSVTDYVIFVCRKME